MFSHFLLLISVGSAYSVCQHLTNEWTFPEAESAGDMMLIYGIKFQSAGPNNVPLEVYVHNAGEKTLCRKYEEGELKPQGGWIYAYCSSGKVEGTYGSLTAFGLSYCGDKIVLVAEYKPKPTAAPEPKPTKAPGPKPTTAPTITAVPLGNLARGQPTWQWGIGWNGSPSRAVDGDRDTNYKQNSCSHTAMSNNPHWAVDLGKSYPVKSVSITNRRDCCANRLKNYDVVVTNTKPSNDDHPFYSSADICIHRGSSHAGTLSLTCTKELKGRYVYIVLKYREYLTLCEVEVFGTVQKTPTGNVARGKPTWQTGTTHHGVSSRAVDGNTNNHWSQNSCTHTDVRATPYWAVDLGKSYYVTGVSITNRRDCCASRLSNYDVMVMNTKPMGENPTYGPAEICIHRSAHHSGTLLMKCTRYVKGRYVMVRLNGRQILTLCEVKVHV